ncbi:MAG TPA: hypothetical protein VGQ11_08550, partial [Candidatus Acidoferrales bacterium]|nr:hypothetical protein [Candidatus Acidoferrales bacterium]
MDYESLANLILNGLYWMNRMVRFIFRRSNKAVEDAILRHIASNRDWYSPSQITNEVFRLAIVGDIPFSIVFPAQLNGIKKFSHWLRQLAIEARHKWRMWWKFVPEEKVRAAMLRMWEQGMLDREPAGDERYRMSERVTVQSDQQPHESKHLWIEFFKAVTGPAALLGLLLAYWSSTQQFAHLSRARNQDRFDRAVSWLGSSNPTERLGGVSGLQLFLDKTPTISGVSDPKEASERQRVALLFLVNAVAVERDTTVQSAILDNLSSLSRFDMPSAVLNEALVAARNRNRGILTTLRDRFNERSLENNKSLIEEAVDEAFLGKLNESELLPLKGTAATIAALIRNGAYTSDLTRIYC